MIGLYVLVLLVPSVNYQVFSGLPLSHAPEYLFGVALLPLVIHKGLRRAFARFLRVNRFLAPGLWTAAGLALVLKVTLFASGDYRGLQACYGSPLSPPPAGRCEASYENSLPRFGVTRLDERLDFGPGDWNLSFLNSLRFNIYPWVPGNRLRDRIPVSATWTGWVHAPDERVVIVDYVGEGQVILGGTSIALRPSYTGPSQATFTLPRGTHRTLVHYTFDDNSQAGRPAPGPYATFRVGFRDGTGAAADVRLAPPRRLPGLLVVAARLADVLVVALGGALLVFYLRLLARDWWWFGLMGAAYLVTPRFIESAGLPVPSSKSISACMVVLLVMLFRRHARDVVGAFFALVALGFAALSPAYASLQAVTLRAAGDDWLTYESFARSILELRSLEGGEPIFYYQPLFRYVRFVEHLLLGDGDLLIVSSAFAALLLAIVWMLRRFNCRRSRLSLGVCVAAGLLMVTVASSATGGLRFLVAGASEYPTWILLPAMLPRLFAARSAKAHLSGTVMLAVSALTRLNQLPALLAVFGAFVVRTHARLGIVVAASGVFVAILLLAPAHNLYYGGRAELLTTSSGIPENYVLPASKVVAAIHDPEARAVLANQLKLVLALSGIERGWALLWPALHGLQVLWIGTLAWAIASRRLTLWPAILAATPALYLGAHVFYQAQGHYPRHILAGHLMMGAVAAMLVFAGSRRSVCRIRVRESDDTPGVGHDARHRE